MTRYYSTNLSAPVAGFDHALIQGLAPDGGLYMPVEIPPMGRNEMEAFSTAGYSDIAASVLGKFLDGLIGRDELAAMAGDAYNFDIPLEEVKDDLFIMRPMPVCDARYLANSVFPVPDSADQRCTKNGSIPNQQEYTPGPYSQDENQTTARDLCR